jgi:hypothetical protein
MYLEISYNRVLSCFNFYTVFISQTQFSYHIKNLSNALGRAMTQAVSRRPSTAEHRVRFRVSPCGVYGGQSGTGTGFSPSCRFYPVNLIPLVLNYL